MANALMLANSLVSSSRGGGRSAFKSGYKSNSRGNSLSAGADAGNPLYLGIEVGMDALLTAGGFAPGVFGRYSPDNISFTDHAPGGANAAASLASVQSQVWDIGIIQNNSPAAAPANIAAHLAKGQILAEQYFTNNGDSRVILYETPAYKDGSSNYPTLFADAPAMRAATYDAYVDLRDQINSANPTRKRTLMAPCGSALYYWGRCLPTSHRQYRSLTAADDDIHYNPDAYTIVCLVLYCILTGKNPDGILDSPEWADVESQMISAPVQDKRDAEAHAYHCSKGTFPILFLADPAAQSVAPGADVTFTVQVDGSAPISYQWFRDGVAIAGQTGNTLTQAGVTLGDNGAKFKCIATNAAGSVESLEATLAVSEALVPFSIDFSSIGGVATPGWTRITAAADSLPNIVGSTFPLVDRSGNPTSYLLRILANTGANGANNNGATGVLGLPNAVTATHFVGVTAGSYQFRLEGLPQTPIVIEACGFRNAGDNGNLDLGYVGATSGTLTFNSRTTPASIPKVTITPDANGHITFTVTSGTGNVSGFNYLAFMRGDPPPPPGPADISGLAGYWQFSNLSQIFDATTGGTTPANGAGIARTEDLSGNGRALTQPTTGNRPVRVDGVINGLPVARFDGSNDVLASSTFGQLTTAGTMFAVIRDTKSSSRSFQTAISNGTGGAAIGANAATYDWGLGRPGDFPPQATQTLVADSPYILVVRWNGTAASVWVNGNKTTATLGSTFAPDTNSIYVGQHNTAGFSWFGGDVAECGAYDHDLLDGEVAQLVAYLSHRYAIPAP